ncbi:Cadmium, cobalt and zinc/H(+)-K(+) antiporter [Gammaproteobacteria bacterium]|nr:Cadmium, cobalt and zinc/H(+)-K(+) antiporter [Gammaproteobacteria bacterium]
MRDGRALRIALVITASFLGVEVVGGLLSGSVALLADAGHMATDVAALALALFAFRVAARGPTESKTYGYRRTEILAALANGLVLVGVSVAVAVDAIGRLFTPPEVETGLMLGVATAGLIANLASAVVLHRGHMHNLNVRGAFLHVVGDALGSLGAIFAALAMMFFGWPLADPIAALAITALILVSAWRLVRESVDVLMESAPGHVDMQSLTAAIRAVPGVVDVHDLHVWTLTSGYHAISAHVGVDDTSRTAAVLRELQTLAAERFDLSHATFQVEPHEPECNADPCAACPPTSEPKRRASA